MKYPQEYSSKIATNEKELLDLLHSTYELTEVEKNCINKVANMCDGHSCERICDLISNLNN
jgi:UDP-N-acetylglucosamine 2-epimerase